MLIELSNDRIYDGRANRPAMTMVNDKIRRTGVCDMATEFVLCCVLP
jgi:hypothetical protein